MNKSSLLLKISMSRSKRGALRITESILEALKEGNELKTHIVYAANIDSKTIMRYMPMLIGMRLERATKSGEYKITEKGL